MMLMAHKEYGFANIPDGNIDEAVSKGWFAVVDMVEAKKALGIIANEEPEDKPIKRGRPKKEA